MRSALRRDANIARFIGLLIAFAMVGPSLGADGVGKVLTAGFHTAGGSCSARASVGRSARTSSRAVRTRRSRTCSPPIAIGWVSVGAITAAGIVAPIVGSLGVDPVVIALGIASGAMFALHVSSDRRLIVGRPGPESALEGGPRCGVLHTWGLTRARARARAVGCC